MVLLGSSVVGTVGEMVGHLEAVIALPGIFKNFINHAAISGRFFVALQGQGPETGGWIAITFKDDEVAVEDAHVFGVKCGEASVVTELPNGDERV